MLSPAAHAFDANGVELGATEAQVLKAFPLARCKPMSWKTHAADRRCDDAEVVVDGANARISIYLRRDAVQAFDLRFELNDLPAITARLKERYGVPNAERTEQFERGRNAREIHKVEWKQGADQAVLSSQAKRRRVDLNVWRGDFDTEIYRFR
ncbi:MAG: hypothetical protein ACREVQ_15695 [Burkholderiales bacterium]